MKMWSHFPTHIHPLIRSMLLSILSCPFKSYSSFFLLQLCHLSMQEGGPHLLSVLRSVSVPFVFFCSPNKWGLAAFNEIYGELTPQPTDALTHTMLLTRLPLCISDQQSLSSLLQFTFTTWSNSLHFNISVTLPTVFLQSSHNALCSLISVD